MLPNNKHPNNSTNTGDRLNNQKTTITTDANKYISNFQAAIEYNLERNNSNNLNNQSDNGETSNNFINRPQQQQQQSPFKKLTHRRGYSHGSYSSLNQQPTTSSHSNNSHNNNLYQQLTNHPSENLGSLGRNTLNNSYEHSFSENIRQLSSSMMKSNSNDLEFGENNSNPSTSSQPASYTLSPNDETKRLIQHFEQKIQKYKKGIQEEQHNRNENVHEYLKLSSNGENTSSSQRFKTIFEKKNQKSSQRITKYQRKLCKLEEELEKIKNGGMYHRPPRERLRDVGTNIKEGISGISGGVIENIWSGISVAGGTVITKPKEFFQKKTPAESSEKNNSETETSNNNNLIVISDTEYHQQQNTSGNSGMLNSNSHSQSHSTKHTSEDDSSSITSGSGHLGIHSHSNSAHYSSSPLQMKPLKRYYAPADFEILRSKIDDRATECLRLNEEIEALKNQFQSECLNFNQAFQDERYRVERIEEQLNDLTELHQKEIENLKQLISDVEEKIQYQMEERHRDVQESLDTFQTRISRMEHQQHQHLQQLVNLDSLDNSNARALVLKLINVLLTVLQVVLLLVATMASILAPFLQTRMRMYTSVLVMIIITFIFHQWPDLDMLAKQKFYENIAYVLGMIPFFPIFNNET